MPKSLLQNLLSEAAELGANAALSAVGVLKPYISKKEAYRMYGEKTVERWIREGILDFEKDGTSTSKCRIDRLKIAAIAKTSNRPSYNQISYTK